MKFKNELERNTFEIAKRVCGNEASIAHNQTLQIEVAIAPEVASFIGPPKKEIDVITAGFIQSAGVKLLISCKQYRNSKAEPVDVQEWAAVVSTMNKYSETTKYLGLVLSPSGFTSGCEPWASSYNLGIIPPLKGKKLDFSLETSGQMLERVLVAFGKRLNFPHQILHEAPQFYEFVYHLTEQFEGRDANAKQYGERYTLLGKGWASSFEELARTFTGKTITEIATTSLAVYITFSDGQSFRMKGKRIEYGCGDGDIEGETIALACEKNFHGQPCSFAFIKSLVAGKTVTSAA